MFYDFYIVKPYQNFDRVKQKNGIKKPKTALYVDYRHISTEKQSQAIGLADGLIMLFKVLSLSILFPIKPYAY